MDKRNLLMPVLGVIGVVVLIAGIVGVFDPDPDPKPGPGWAEPEVLPDAEPVWSADIAASNGALIHDDVLVRAFGAGQGTQSQVLDLATGDEIWKSNLKYPAVWLSGDHLIAMEALNGDEAVVHDLNSGKKIRTIPLTKFATVAVASGVLVSVEPVGEDDSAMRGIDVDTGKELWRKDLSKSHQPWDLGAPSHSWQSDLTADQGVFTESTSPVVLLHRNSPAASDLWDRVDAIDVATGDENWTSPISYEDKFEPRESGFVLTESGDIFTEVSSGYGDDAEQKSYVIDISTGKTTDYPVPAEAFDGKLLDAPLQGDQLQTGDAVLPLIRDVTTGKPLWRSKDEHGRFMHRGDVVFEETSSTPEEPGQSGVDGVRAYDVASGEALWTRQGVLDAKALGVGEDIVTTGFAKPAKGEPPIQVFDRGTGDGKWQIRAHRLAAHDDDYFVFIEEETDDSARLHVVSRTDPR